MSAQVLTPQSSISSSSVNYLTEVDKVKLPSINSLLSTSQQAQLQAQQQQQQELSDNSPVVEQPVIMSNSENSPSYYTTSIQQPLYNSSPSLQYDNKDQYTGSYNMTQTVSPPESYGSSSPNPNSVATTTATSNTPVATTAAPNTSNNSFQFYPSPQQQASSPPMSQQPPQNPIYYTQGGQQPMVSPPTMSTYPPSTTSMPPNYPQSSYSQDTSSFPPPPQQQQQQQQYPPTAHFPPTPPMGFTPSSMIPSVHGSHPYGSQIHSHPAYFGPSPTNKFDSISNASGPATTFLGSNGLGPHMGGPVHHHPHHGMTMMGGRAVKPKRKRATPEQTNRLNEVFAETFFPTSDQRMDLAMELGMTPRTVQIWFQNKRQGWRSEHRRPIPREPVALNTDYLREQHEAKEQQELKQQQQQMQQQQQPPQQQQLPQLNQQMMVKNW